MQQSNGTTANGPWLVADVGGTNARFGWVEGAGAAVQHIEKLPAAGHAGPADAVRTYLDGVRQQLGAAYRPPRRAAVAVATAISGDEVAFTNSHWRFSRRQLQADLDLDALLVLNDFEALALSLPRLGPAQLRSQAPLPQPQGTLVVIGPGTGLGVGAVTQTAHGWVAIPGEGGHATLSAADDFDSALLQAARREFAHVSAERLLSGIGLPVLHRAVATVMARPAETLAAEQIVERALGGVGGGLGGGDEVCERTIDSFCALLGSFAGNVALTLGARGGVYIGGGIVPRFGDRFFASRFRERFESKGRFRAYLQEIPTALITDTLAALSGAALALEQLGP